MTKTCSKCGEEKALEDFSPDKRRKDGLSSHCKGCHNKIVESWRENGGRKRESDHKRAKRESYLEKFYKYKDIPCADCGGVFPRVCMDFDHRNPEEKVENITTMVYTLWSEDKIFAEIAKCDVVCANCHRIRTASREKPWDEKRRKF